MHELIIHLIVNKQSGAGKGSKVCQIAEDYFNELNIPYHTYITEYAGHEKKIVTHLKQTVLKKWHHATTRFPLLVVLGGDGTLHEVVNALKQSPDIPMAYIPGGSGNDFARGTSIPRQTKQAIDLILNTTQPTPIELIEANFSNQTDTRLILNNVGIGLDAAIVATANASSAKTQLNKYNLGSLSYLAAVLKVLKKQPAFPITITTDSETKEFKQAYLCTTTNHPYFGGGVAIDPTASPFEKKISLVVLEKINRFKIFYLAIRLLNKKHLESKYVSHFKTDVLSISSPSVQFGQADGEELGEQPYDIEFQLTERLFWV